MSQADPDPGTPAGQSILVTGAGSQIGRFLLPRLLAAGSQVIALSRKPGSDRPGLRWWQGDLGSDLSWPQADALIHLAFLPLLPRHIEALARAGVTRLIAFSSTSRLTKAASPDAYERDLAAHLAGAETETMAKCAQFGLAWTLFRPTLIYGAGMDRNVTFIQHRLRRFGCFPLVGGGSGRRQPVHAEDLALACLAVLTNAKTYERIYALPGGETLSYREMVERIGLAIGRRPRFLPLSQLWLERLLGILRWFPGMGFLTPEMARRMNQDLVFDDAPARQDFDYRPRAFSPGSVQAPPGDLGEGFQIQKPR